MKEITIKFNGLGYYQYNQANILLYDKQQLVYSGYTYNGKIKIKVKKNHVYRMIASINNDKIETSIYTASNKYCFNFKRAIINYNYITFILTDYYYNLPIERGNLIIWQK